ncbi:MAG: tetratricopeptide repeat protein, partial [Myxococcota bacterium]
MEEVLEIYDEARGEIDEEQLVIGIHLRMAELSWEYLREADKADTHFRRVLEYDARNEAAFAGLVRLYEAQERWQDAVSVLQQRARMAGDEGATLRQLRETARILDERAGDLDGAIEAYRRILEMADQDAEALRGLANLYERREEWQSLIAILERQEEVAETLADKVALRARIAHLWESALENPEQAVFVHRSILTQDEAYAPSMKALERLYTALQRPHELIETYERMCAATDEPKEQIRFLEHIVRLWEGLEDGDLDAAIEAADRILGLDAEHLGAIEALERLLRRTRDWERLLSCLQRHIELLSDPKARVPLFLAMGEIYQKELGRTEAAERALKGALEADPGSVDALGALGKLYERSGNWADALDKLKKQALVAGATAEGTELQYRIGKINEEMLLDRAAAQVAYERALEIDPRYLPALRAMKELARAAKDNSAFLVWLKREAQCAEQPSEQTALHTEAGIFQLEVLEDKEGAIAELEAALAIEYDYLPAARALAELCFSTEQWERAEQVLDVVVEQLDADVESAALGRAHYRLAYACERLAKEQKALKSYQRTHELDPTYLPGLEGLAGALWRAERYEDAVKIYQAILLHHREDLTDAEVVDYYQQVAQLFFLLNDYERARSNVARALDIDSSHLSSLQLLAKVCRAQNEHEDAYETLMRTVPQLAGEERVNVLIEIGQL